MALSTNAVEPSRLISIPTFPRGSGARRRLNLLKYDGRMS